jgi:hypothetical protein
MAVSQTGLLASLPTRVRDRRGKEAERPDSEEAER